MSLGSDEMREIYRHTVIIRKPTYGIVSGYHELPYVCLGAGIEKDSQTTRVRGKVQVSPRFVIRPQHLEPSYGEVFGEENVDSALSGRLFGFMGFRSRPVECKSEGLELQYLDASVDRVLSETLDDLERREDITTGVFVTPDARYFPVSIERFISSIIDEEFSM